MKSILVIAALCIAGSAFAKDTYVKPHVRKDGTFVEGHYKKAPNSTKLDNYSTKDNTNPYTGKTGTVDPFKVDTTPTYKPPKTKY